MLTIDKLQEFGADTEKGLNICMGNEGFYLKLVNMAIVDDGFSRLENAFDNKDLDAAFEAAHSLKGVLGNLSLTPLYNPVAEMTELLRRKEDADYEQYLSVIRAKHAELSALAAS